MSIGIETNTAIIDGRFVQQHRCVPCTHSRVHATGGPVTDNGFVPRGQRLEHGRYCPNRAGSDWSEANLSDLSD